MAQPLRAVLCALAALFAGSSARATVTAVTNATGLASLKINGFETIGDQSYQGRICTYGCDITLRRADGTTRGGNGLPLSRTAIAPGKVRLAFDWGIVDVSFANAGVNKLVTDIKVTNTGTETIATVGGPLFVLDFPVTPVGTDHNGTGPLAEYPRSLNAARGVPALHIGLGSVGSMLLQQEGDLRAPVTFGRMTGYNSPTRYSFRWDIDGAILPGSSRTVSVAMLSGGPKASYAAMAAGVARSWAGSYPQTVAAWTDRRPIAAIFMSGPPPHPPTNPRGWFGNDATVDVTTPAGLQTFRTRVLDYFGTVVALANDMGAQGIMVWDIEGQEQPGAASYVCDPTVLNVITPEMNYQGAGDARPLADEAFARVRAAGLKVGVCLRPQRWNVNGSSVDEFQPDQPDPDVVIDTKADYAVTRWGASMFYVDSNVHPDFGFPIPAHFLFDRALARHPDILFGGEWQDEASFSNGAPYDATTYDDTRTITSPIVRYPYPGAFSMIRVGPAADGRPASTFRSGYKAAIRRGDILMALGWYVPPESQMVKELYAEIGARPSVSITTPATGLTIAYTTPILLAATANDADGTISRVEYFDGPTKLGTALAAPWRVGLNALSVRTHAIVAKTTDNSGNTSFSVPVTVTVTP